MDLEKTELPVVNAGAECGCGPAVPDTASSGEQCLAEPFVVGRLDTAIGPIPQVSSTLTRADGWGAVKSRLGLGRRHYRISPGLYALGTPDADADVLVTANYKLSFDRLRAALPGRDLWILVLDTMGINVWCAAGKGTFGTAELVRRIAASRLAQVVRHRRVILPQLGAPGVAAHRVREGSGFKVRYGPVRAADLPAFLDAGLKATPEMRRVTFTVAERAVLIPVELGAALKHLAILVPVFVLLGGLGGPGPYWDNVAHAGWLAALALMTAAVGSVALVPVLLPWLPGRAFSLKGVFVGLGLMLGLGLIFWRGSVPAGWQDRLDTLAWVVLGTTLSAFWAMNFTGASTYTSLSGVKKEMRVAVPLQVGAALIGLGLWVSARLSS